MDTDGLIGGLLGIAVLGAVMNCFYCGSSFNSRARTCPHCGKKRKR